MTIELEQVRAELHRRDEHGKFSIEIWSFNRRMEQFILNYGNCRSSKNTKQIDWRQRCREILEVIWNSSNSVPFREPVDTLEHPGTLDTDKGYFSSASQ